MYTDPISDYLTRIRNAIKARKKTVEIPASNLKKQITDLLLKHSFISDFKLMDSSNKQGTILIKLKYHNDDSVIMGLQRVSKPGIRKYVSHDEIPRVLNGLGISIISTSRGLMTDKDARSSGIGGEIICNIW
jgi:small subunit ribosomal protein S8